MPSLPDDVQPIVFGYQERDGSMQLATVMPSQESMRIHYEILSAISMGKPELEISRMRMDLTESTHKDAEEYVSKLPDNTQSGTGDGNTAVPPTDTNSAQSPPTAGSQNPSVFGPARPPPKQD
jgi:hypothetical protein